MTCSAFSLPIESFPPTRGRGLVKAALRRLRCGDGYLICMERRELRGDHVWRAPCVSGVVLGGDRVLVLVAKSHVKEGALAVHLGRGDIGVPVWDRPVACPRV